VLVVAGEGLSESKQAVAFASILIGHSASLSGLKIKCACFRCLECNSGSQNCPISMRTGNLCLLILFVKEPECSQNCAAMDHGR